MDTFLPEFSKFWQQDAGAAPVGAVVAKGDDDACAQRVALEELAERVTAARSVV